MCFLLMFRPQSAQTEKTNMAANVQFLYPSASDTGEGSVELDDNFCCSCGTELCHETIAIIYYFKQGYEYNTIVEFLSKFHGIPCVLGR